MKRKLLVMLLLLTALLLCAGFALAEDPIVCSMEVSPSSLTAPGDVTVTITISNSGDTDMTDPLTLYNQNGEVVQDFGTNGSVILKAGETKTYTGGWSVNQRTLNNGMLIFYVQYTLYRENGESYSENQPIRGAIRYQTSEAGMEAQRTISPGMAREGQTVTVKYDIVNTGTVSLLDINIKEHDNIYIEPQKIAELKAGETAHIKFTVEMGTKDLVSGATITYKTATSNKTQSYTVEDQTIVYGEPAMGAKLTASAKGVEINGAVTLTLELTNSGNVEYSDLRVTDPVLGDVFPIQTLPAEGKLTLTKEIILTTTTEYQFTISAIDNTNTPVSFITDPVTVQAVDPNEMLHLTLVATPDRTEVYEQPGNVRFTINITNDSSVDAKEVSILHGNTRLYTYTAIPAGETRTFTRDTALSMAGKYQFRAETVDLLGNTVSFPSNEMTIAFSVPTPTPVVTPIPVITPEPTFEAQPLPRIADDNIAPLYKLIQKITLPVVIICGLGLVCACVLLLIASRRRMAQRKASEAAYDHLERARRRDYVLPAEEDATQSEPEKPTERAEDEDDEQTAWHEQDDSLDELELPHMEYMRSAYQQAKESKLTGDDADDLGDVGRDAYRPAMDAVASDTDDLYADGDVMYEQPDDAAYEQADDVESYTPAPRHTAYHPAEQGVDGHVADDREAAPPENAPPDATPGGRVNRFRRHMPAQRGQNNMPDL